MKDFFKPLGFNIILALFLIASFVVENLNGHFHLNDFKVYYDASLQFSDGLNPYGQAYGLSSGYFKYAPPTLYLFLPYTYFDFETARIIHYLVMSVLIFFIYKFLFKLSRAYFGEFAKPKHFYFLLWLFIFSLVHLTRELHLGNVNLILIFLTLISLDFIRKKKKTAAGVSLSLLILLKPYFAIVILPLMIKREWKVIFIQISTTFAFIALPFLISGFNETTQLYQDWLTSMKSHSTGMFSEHTFTSIVYSYSGIKLNDYWQMIFIFLAIAMYFYCRLKQLINNSFTYKEIISDTFILIALIPNLVITDTQHFLYTLPLISLILVIITNTEQKTIYILIFAVLFFLYGANANDLLGHRFSNALDRYSTIGVANFLLILFFIFLNGRKEKI